MPLQSPSPPVRPRHPQWHASRSAVLPCWLFWRIRSPPPLPGRECPCWRDHVYKVHAGPSTRRIIDFSDVENARSILPTGQSGNVFSKHYNDQAEKYLRGEFIKMMLNKKEIRASKDVLVFMPRGEWEPPILKWNISFFVTTI